MTDAATPGWTFLTRHAQVLLCIAEDPGIRLRDIGARVGVTERAAHRIVGELEAAGYISRERRCPTGSPASRRSATSSASSRAAGHRRDDLTPVRVHRRVLGVVHEVDVEL